MLWVFETQRDKERGLESGRTCLYDLNSEGPRLQGSRTFLRVLCGGHRGDWGYKCEWRQGVELGGSSMLYVYYWSPGRDRAACVLETVARHVLDCRHTVRSHSCSSSSTVDSSLALEDRLRHLLLTECGVSCL